jgi:SulP family sulfate permease
MGQNGYRGLLTWLQAETEPKKLMPGLMTGVMVGITEVILAASLGSLIFSGPLASYIHYGMGAALLTAAVMMVATALLSSIPAVMGSIQDSPSVILSVIAAGTATALSTGSSREQLASVLAVIAFTTLLTGFFFLTLGWFSSGRLVRYVPYPVVGGFLAGTGWLLARGSFGVMTAFPLTTRNLPALIRTDQLELWLPGVLFAFILFFGIRRIRHFMTMPGILLGTILVFYLGLWITDTSIADATDKGLLVGGLSSGATLPPFPLQYLLGANWGTIFGQGGNIAIVLILSVVSLLLNASALELTIKQDVDLDHELKVAGVANLLSGFGGGMVGYHALSLSAISYRVGARGRLPGLIAGSLCAIALLVGPALLAYFPKFVLGGLLFFLGLDFLAEWVVASWSKLSRGDYAVVLLILAVIATTNFLIGVGVGLIAMVILFVLNYSRINIVHHTLSGAEVRSNVERCAYHRRVLAEELGRRIFILELEGFLFFGTANALLERIRARVADMQQRVLYIILDFRRVAGLDSSAVLSFVKGKQLAEASNITLVLTHVSEKIQHQFKLGGLFEKSESICMFPDLDHGLEWCEDELLELERVTALHFPVTLSAQLADSGFAKPDTLRLLKFLEQVKFCAGDYLIHQGEDADKLYFIELGTVSIYLETGVDQPIRLQTLGLGTAVGETSLYLGGSCTASVVADTEVHAYRLTRETLTRMKQEEPELAATFHEFAAHLLSERLVSTTRALEAMIR